MRRFFPRIFLLLALSSVAAGPVRADDPPSLRIVSLAPSITETLFALGAGNEVVGVTSADDYPSAARSIARVGGEGTFDLERIVELAPRLVLAASIDDPRTIRSLRALGLTVVLVPDAPDVRGVLVDIEAVGAAIGRTEEAEALTKRLSERIHAIARRVAGRPEPRVFWELSGDLWTAGPGSFVDDLIRLAGGKNIAEDARSPWVQLSAEQVIARDPEVIFLADGTEEEARSVRARPGWAAVSAVRSGRVLVVPDVDIVSRPGPRIAEALEFVARSLHPGAF